GQDGAGRGTPTRSIPSSCRPARTDPPTPGFRTTSVSATDVSDGRSLTRLARRNLCGQPVAPRSHPRHAVLSTSNHVSVGVRGYESLAQVPEAAPRDVRL